MTKLHFVVAGIPFEVEGDEQAVSNFVQQVLNRFVHSGASSIQTQLEEDIKVPLVTVTKIPTQKPLFKAPSREEVKQFIMNKQDYSHNMPEVQMHFFNHIFKARGENGTLYHAVAQTLRDARKEIAEQQEGKFDETLSSVTGVKQFLFKKNTDASIMQ